MVFTKCLVCDKPLVCEGNLKILRGIVIGSTVGAGILGVAALPLIGFGLGGIAAGSFAAAWQSSIGAVAAGSLFAVLQSLGATGLGMLLFGSVASAMGLLGSLAARLNWCTCDDAATAGDAVDKNMAALKL